MALVGARSLVGTAGALARIVVGEKSRATFLVVLVSAWLRRYVSVLTVNEIRTIVVDILSHS